jgi:hypothetical protein
MQPSIKIILSTIICSFFSVGLFIISGLGLFLFAIAGMFGGGNVIENSTANLILFLLCFCGFLVSFTICPILSYFIRHSILKVTAKSHLRLLIFLLVGGSQIILLLIGYNLIYTYEYFKRSSFSKSYVSQPIQKHPSISDLRKANVEVIVKNARVIYADKQNVVAKITLQIKNVPTILPHYFLSINEVGEKREFTVDIVNSGPQIPKSSNNLKAVYENNSWVFYDPLQKNVFSENADEITFNISFHRYSSGSKSLPKTITPLLKIHHSKDKKTELESGFFNKPISITFENRIY